MNYAITFEKAAKKFIKKQSPKMQTVLLTVISKLPNGTDIKKLQGHDLYRMRVGNVRIIYSIDNDVKIINIENIDNRGQIYKKY